MNSSLILILGLCFLPALVEGVTVKVGNYSFPWNSVKMLKNILDATPHSPHLRSTVVVPVCLDPLLPPEFVSLCTTPKAAGMIKALDTIASDPETCEICANIACSGC